MKQNEAFTLVEVVVCLIITFIVAFFVYTMMLSSYKSYSKLYDISGQRNDIRYFEKLFRNSIINAEDIKITGNSISCGYYDISGMFSDGYRLDVYEFGNGILSNGSVNLENADLSSYGTTDSLVYLTIKRADSDYNPVGTPLRVQEVILKHVNKMYYQKTSSNDNNHEYYTFSLIYNKPLSDGEINYEAQTYKFTVKNKKFKS